MDCSLEFYLKRKEFRAKGSISLRETWFEKDLAFIGQRNSNGWLCIDIEWPSNDKNDKELRFPRVTYKYDEAVDKLFEDKKKALEKYKADLAKYKSMRGD